MSEMIDRQRLLQLLRDSFGHKDFRPGQEPVVQHVAAGRDALVVMPTGAGKSLCYQLPALYRDGLTLVVSPLIALMKDQVDALSAAGIAATFINSSVSPEEREQRLAQARSGEIRLLYVAPERFRGGGFVRRLGLDRIALLAIDEAHCLSQWGHDFRPDYLRLGAVREQLGDPPTVALTATATAEVRDDIVQTLRLSDHGTFVTGFDRPNLKLSVLGARSRPHKEELLGLELARVGRPVIIYCATRRSVDAVTRLVRKRGERADGYHGGLAPEERSRIQDEFMGGRTPVIAATNAFGMGVDKEDLRAVLHFDMPKTIEAYYQEIGRAGRDGAPADVTLLYRHEDRGIQEFFIDNAHPPEQVVRGLWDALEEDGCNPVFRSQRSLADQIGAGTGDRTVGAAMIVLEREGLLRRLPIREGMAEVSFAPDLDSTPKRAGLPREVWEALCRLRRQGGHPVDGMGMDIPPPPITDDFWPSEGEQPTPSSRPVGPRQVPVHMPSLAGELGVDRARLGGALRRLEELRLVQVVSAERCSGARLLRKGQPFEIDFAPLRDRRAREIDKLDKMVLFAEEESCRRRYILRYFGEDPDWEGCGNCDVCRRGGGELRKPEVLSGAAETIARKALACVARMGNGYSAGLVTKVLTGSAAKNVRLMGFDTLSTFGLLKELTQEDVSAVLRALIRVGCLVQTEVSRPVKGTERRYRVLNLSPLGARVMRRQEAGFEMLFPEVGPLARSSVATLRGSRSGLDPSLDGEARGLFDKLREVRRALAEEGGVPTYAMGTNRLLREIATHRPGSRRAMLGLHGMGERMFDKVGQPFLQVVEAFSPR